MKKRRFDWLRKTSSADVMNPKNYEYRLKQLDDDNPAEQKEAYTWFQKHAEEGDASAQYQTAMCFLHGVGVEKMRNNSCIGSQSLRNRSTARH